MLRKDATYSRLKSDYVERNSNYLYWYDINYQYHLKQMQLLRTVAILRSIEILEIKNLNPLSFQ